MKHILLIAALAVLTPSANAQKIIHETEVAFTRSQEARAEAVKAFRAGDLDAALAGMLGALTDRPTSIALLGNAAFLAAETGDTDTALKLTQRFIKLGVNPGAGIQAKLKEKLTDTDWQALEKLFAQNAVQIGGTHQIASIPSDHKLVEGIATDDTGNLYFSTVVSGTLLKTDTAGNTSVLFDSAKHMLGSFFGIAYNQSDRSLYATYATIDQTPERAENRGVKSADTGVVKIDVHTGKMLQNWALPGGSDNQQIADITITDAGTVFVADARGNKLYRITGDALTAIPTTAQFINPQGIIARSENDVLMADYGRGLWRINTHTGAATLYGVPDNAALAGIDGLFTHKGRIIAIQNGTSPQRMIEIHLDDSADAVTHVTPLAQSMPVFDEPTLGTSTKNGIIFVASSQWPKFDSGGTLREGMTLQPTIILRLPDENIR